MGRLFFAFLICLCFASPAQAAELEGIQLADTIIAGDTTLQLNGMALRKKFFFKIYVGGLYLPSKATDAAATLATDQPAAMLMHYMRDVDADRLIKGWRAGFQTNTPGASDDLKQRFEHMVTFLKDAPEDTIQKFVYTPGHGTDMVTNDTVIVTIPGHDFFQSLLATWLGPKADVGEDFTADLMSQ